MDLSVLVEGKVFTLVDDLGNHFCGKVVSVSEKAVVLEDVSVRELHLYPDDIAEIILESGEELAVN